MSTDTDLIYMLRPNFMGECVLLVSYRAFSTTRMKLDILGSINFINTD